ncbi:serine/threonine-protein phosphatase with EF-hands 2 [Salmo salar]|uniref:Serine/threonine-protein phosphatase with EF-hands 2 n=1 Tax=Salmo salar TaxID=8030 RepID=A0A1S3NLF7_SALSA|nr:serine/threonine-protein phosphatase with EF-hands 2-like [Salmo salar]|eukprot:XP_014016080.1 PREDICTED: serine/threonine-protein phosphatase with EF-hands 2-like isoform X2 [Salmo salar]
MPQNGCVPSEVWGGGCSWGPDVTQGFLNRHNMQLISRSHGCKQDGYKFCHNRRCEVGCNRGAYMKLGPDLVPYLIQYQASSMTRTHPEEKCAEGGNIQPSRSCWNSCFHTSRTSSVPFKSLTKTKQAL